MKILVTGGAGFIGSHVCDEFLSEAHEVIALDNLSTGRKENLNPKAQLATLDIRSSEAADFIRRQRPDVVCHLAAQMDVRKSVEDPRFDAEANILGLLNVLEASRGAGVKRFIFSSTGGAIYGEQDVYPAPETHATRPVSPYGFSKAAGELYLGYYRAQYGLPFIALRY
ncbi:MAG TPA: NAD-dependent epimerase/dehydratase family protein, partial [Myxococcaceae bacterium]|nr:NAD-dependent epimerase/dehydratase family protein [Myxococcaceae bacterium]